MLKELAGYFVSPGSPYYHISPDFLTQRTEFFWILLTHVLHVQSMLSVRSQGLYATDGKIHSWEKTQALQSEMRILSPFKVAIEIQ